MRRESARRLRAVAPAHSERVALAQARAGVRHSEASLRRYPRRAGWAGTTLVDQTQLAQDRVLQLLQLGAAELPRVLVWELEDGFDLGGAGGQHEHAVREPQCFFHVVRDEHHGVAFL